LNEIHPAFNHLKRHLPRIPAAQLESIHPPEDSLAAQMQGGGFLNMGPYDR
jgi:hypothetical protein